MLHQNHIHSPSVKLWSLFTPFLSNTRTNAPGIIWPTPWRMPPWEHSQFSSPRILRFCNYRFQGTLKASQGCSNTQSLFNMINIPSDNNIRNLLDPVPPQAIFPLFSTTVNAWGLTRMPCIENPCTVIWGILPMENLFALSSITYSTPQCMSSANLMSDYW